METILIADDNIFNCSVLSKALKEVGYNADYVCNGQEVFNYLSTHRIDILLLDVNMPIKNGFEVLEELNQKNTKVKVIVVTAYANIKSIIDAAKLGARDFISKPYDFDELLITIRKVLMNEVY